MMKKFGAVIVAFLFYASFAIAGGGLDSFLNSLNVQARADINGFAARIGAQFGIPGAQVNAVLSTVREPADAFMVYQLGQMSRQPPERVVDVYQSGNGKGWGVIAKELGIKPGSREFHALKRGDFELTGNPGASHGKDKGKGKGKGKGHNK